jgi:menaquinone-dependent protoporphyrinogen oxidase
MNVLVTAASREGSTLDIAEAIAARLREQGFEVTVAAPDSVAELHPYDVVIIGSAVYAGRWLDGARDFVVRHRRELAQRPVWLFSSGPVGPPGSRLARAVAAAPADLAPILEATAARGHQVFGGKVGRGRVPPSRRLLLRLVPQLAGDWRDWGAIEAWADEIATALARTEWFKRLDRESA